MGDNPGLLFRGKSDQFTSDRKLEADKATQQLVLKLQSLKSAPIPSKRRQTGPDPRPKKIKMSPQNQPFPAPQRSRGRGRGNSSRGNPSRGKPRGRGTYPATKSNHIWLLNLRRKWCRPVGTSSHRRHSRISLARMASIRSQALGGEHSSQGVQTGFHRETKVISIAHLFPASKITTESNIAGDWNKQAHRKESSRICTPRDSGLLQSHVSSLQGRKQMATNNWPLSLKYHAMDTEFPHGDTRIHPHSYPAERLDCVYRPLRRLFAHTSQCTRSEISQICIQRRKSAIQSTALWSCDKPVVVYPDNDRGEDHGFTKGHNYSPVLGQLADKISEQTSTTEPNKVVTSPMQNPRAENKPRKIRVDTNKGFHFCGLPVQNPDKQGLPHTEENRANTTESNIISQFSGSPSKTMAISYRPTSGNREASPNGKNSHERFTVLSKTSVAADRNKSQSVSSDRPPSTHRASVVVQYDKSQRGSPHAPSESRHSDFHGLINGGLGSPYTEPGSVRGMVAQRENITHKQFRATAVALKHWERVVIGKTILVASDNSTVVAYINKQGGTVSRSLCMEAREMLIWCHQREIILRARYIPGKLNALADQLSRRGQIIILHTEWSLCPRIFKHCYATSSPSPGGTCLQQSTTRNWKSMHLQCRTQNPKL